MLTQNDLQIATLGEATHPSPQASGKFVADGTRVLFNIECLEGEAPNPVGFEKAGPRQRLFFDPTRCRAAIVTCGGLCPGLNNVIRNLFYTLNSTYGVPQVLGIRNGFAGLNPAIGTSPVWLTSDMVEHIHHRGGTILGTSRGPQDPAVMVDFLRSHGVNLLFTIGGDGTLSAAHKIAQEVGRRGAKIAVVGIPKTIDNDIKYCYRSFGFISAVAEAERVIDRAHVEAKSVPGGVGLVKLMGREAGFIAAAATIASGEVNFTLIPEAPFELQGPGGLLAKLEARLRARQHAVIVVAEGAGQHLLTQHSIRTDQSGNPKLGDIGVYLSQQITDHFRHRNVPVSVKYFDPSYYIRSVHAGAADSLLCEQLARYAAHAALAGKTDLLVSVWHDHAVHVPLAMSTGAVKRLDTQRDLWNAVLAITGQERW